MTHRNGRKTTRSKGNNRNDQVSRHRLRTLTDAGFAPNQVDALVNVFRNTYTDPVTRGELDQALDRQRNQLPAESLGDLYRALWVQTGVIVGAVIAISRLLG